MKNVTQWRHVEPVYTNSARLRRSAQGIALRSRADKDTVLALGH